MRSWNTTSDSGYGAWVKLAVYCGVILFGLLACCAAGCSHDPGKVCDLSTVHHSFQGVVWGDNFSDIAKRITLVRTDFGGNDREPAFQVMKGLPLDMGGVPIRLYFQFVNNKLYAVHIFADKNHRDELIAVVHALYGEPKKILSEEFAIWQDAVASIAFQRNVRGDGCLFSVLNNKNYMQLTGRKVSPY